MPRTAFHQDSENAVSKLFWGRVDIQFATSYYYYAKGSRYQKLIHKIKYKGEKELGQELGRLFGLELRNSPLADVDIIIPVPLHIVRQRKRGYNQSEWIAKGIASSLNKPIDTSSVERVSFSSTQTRKSRYARWENVEGIFSLKIHESIIGKHVLIIDDVVTTGSTLEACAVEVLKAKGTKVSIATLAIA
jgi:ComF family protein